MINQPPPPVPAVLAVRSVSERAAQGRTIAEMAQEFQVGPTTMWRWTRRPGFPRSLGYRLQRGLHDPHDYREPRGRPPEIWDLGQVRGWRAEQLAVTWTARVERERAAARVRRQLETDRVDAMIRRRRADGQLLRAIAAGLDVPYGRVRRVAAGQPRPPADGPARRRRRWTDAAIIDALTTCGPVTAAGYRAWRRQQRLPRPSLDTIILRYGRWSSARQAASGGDRPTVRAEPVEGSPPG